MMHTFVGEISRDPDIVIDDKTDRARANLAVSVVERWRDATGQWRTKPAVVWDCWAWSDRARAIAAANLAPGTPVIVQGKFRTSVWTNAYGDEQRRTVFDIFHLGIDLAGRRPAAPDTQTQPTEGRDTTNAWDTPEEDD